MKKSVKFSPEVRERAVRLVTECRKDHPSQWAAIESIAAKIGCSAATLHTWVRRHEIDTGMRDGVTSDERERIKALERENKELHRVRFKDPATGKTLVFLTNQMILPAAIVGRENTMTYWLYSGGNSLEVKRETLENMTYSGM